MSMTEGVGSATARSRARGTLAARVVAVTTAVTAMIAGLGGTAPAPAGAQVAPHTAGPSVTLTLPSGPAYAADAPDPDVVRAGSTYYAYTTGTTWGNHIGVLIDTSGTPASGWRTVNGLPYASTALPSPPAWEQNNTQTSPGVIERSGVWYLYYDAYDPAVGYSCLSVATASTPAGPFTDTSSGPFECQPSLGGSVDPSPMVDPTTGQIWLTWKSDDGTLAASAELWSAPLAPDMRSFSSPPQDILTQNTVAFPWQATIENPDMVDAGGTFLLFFAAGVWDSSGYTEGMAVCSSPAGPCTEPLPQPFLTSFGPATGPGAATAFTDTSGHWWLAFAAWSPSCTSYSCGGARQLYTAPMVVDLGDGPLGPPPPPPVVGMARTADGGGYWITTSDGDVFPFGDAVSYGSLTNVSLNQPIVGMAATADGKGYWLVASDGGIFSFGDAVFHGSTGALRLNKPIVGMARTADGGGYWLVASDGGIFSFGDAVFHGSTGALHLNKPVVGMATTADGRGYWLVASDGGIFSFGDAVFHGSTGALILNKPIVGMATTPDGGGYWLVASDGGIFTFGDASYHGSTG